jgi:cell division protein FtsI (penicillin-binding protein 3)
MTATYAGDYHFDFAETEAKAPAAIAKDSSRLRIRLVAVGFAVVYAVICGRLVTLGFDHSAANSAMGGPAAAVAAARPDLTDRNGEILATDITTASLYAEPRNIIDADEAAEAISSVFPDIDTTALRHRLETDAGFIWIRREITAEQQEAIHRLGIPGVGFISESRRFYPGGSTASHIVGHVNIDNQGIAGIEKFIDDQGLSDLHDAGFALGGDMAPVALSIDLRVQHVLHDELAKAMERYQAIAATGVVLDVNTGEVMAMASIPDYDPNNPAEALQPDRLNRMTAGVYEMGSVMKTFNTAMALDSGLVSIDDSFDASRPLSVSRYTISDFHGKNRVLTVPEIFIYSSNIGSARMALTVGVDRQQEFFRRMGMGGRITTELPETASPLLPSRWTDISAMTISFGHGVSVTPMHVAMGAAALLNGGMMIPPTFMPRSEETAAALAHRVVSQETSDMMRYLFRLNVERGSGRSAEVPGYYVGGKTGTAEKIENGRYSSSLRFNSFLAAFPMDNPQYVVLVVLDEPQPERPGLGATAGSNAAPAVASIIRRSAPFLGVEPQPVGTQPGALLVTY